MSTYGTGLYGSYPYGVSPGMGDFAQAVYDQLNIDSILDQYPDAIEIMSGFIGALGEMFEQIDEIAHPSLDTDGNMSDRWSKLLDIDRIPDEGIVWFSQFTGVQINANLDTNDQRQQIRDRVGWKRGTMASIAAAVQAVLTGTQTVQFVERDTSAYHFNVATYSTETPSSAAVTAAITAAKPAGLQFTYSLIAGSPGTTDTYENLFLDYGSYATVFSNEQSYQDVFTNP